MRIARVLTLLSFLLATPMFGVTGTTYAQLLFDLDDGGPRSSADAVAIETHLSRNLVPAGEEFKVAVVLDIAEGWHINAHRPTFEYLIGTEVSVHPHPDFLLSDIRYPRPRRYAFEFAGGETLDVYEGRAIVYLAFRTASDVAAGHQELSGRVRVQACDDQICLAPSTVDLTIPLEVVDAGRETESINRELFAGYDEAAVTGGHDIAGLIESRGLLIALISIFLIGLALNLTPCVYPMLSVTVSLFGGQADPNTRRVFIKAVVYVLGIALMYSALGVIAAMTGGMFGGWLQNPWLLAAIGALLLGLALSMFGLYELQPPYWLTSRLGGAAGASGYAGLFLSGLVVGVFAAPCIGPPIIALLAFVGSKGDPLFGFVSFFVLSLGLGLPYLILGTFSGLLRKLPRSGDWMVWVKKLFGVVLVGAGLFFLGLALFPAIVEWVIPATLACGGIYLGFVERSGAGRPVFRGFKWAIGLAAIIAASAVVLNLQKDGIEWEPYGAERIEYASAQNRPVVMDFYADWCIPCIELERRTFTHSEVRALSESFERLKVDLTHFDSPEAEVIRRRYDIAGVPTVVFLDENGVEVREARVVGFVPPDEFLRRMRMVVPG